VTRVASFHLASWSNPIRALSRLALDRRALAGVSGLELWRLCGTGAGSSTTPGADPRRTALFCLWSAEGDLDAFLETHRVARAWRSAREYWHVRLAGAGGTGSWRGVPVPELLADTDDGGVIAVVTRADVRPSSWRSFVTSGRPVDASLAAADGLLATVAIGEAPRYRLGTFSLWRDADAMRTWAHGTPEHVEVMRRTRAERWYGEEMFARFRPYASEGSWDGRDPLSHGASMP
jgi:heme-degrading monooxygenase HmoA